MILIVSKERLEPSTEDVMDWLGYYKAEFTRFNGDTLYQKESICVELDNKQEVCAIGGFALDSENQITIKSAWFRRWSDEAYKDRVSDYNLPMQEHNSIIAVMKADQAALRDYFFSRFRVGHWLTHPADAVINKLDVLRKAKQCGLDIPESLVCTKKKSLKKFKDIHERIISKDLSIPFHFHNNGTRFGSYTFEVDDDAMAVIPDQFIPSLFQKLIQKRFEIRAFYLDGKFYSMAIFSQADQQTATDFRNYTKKGNRTVPYLLPEDIDIKLRSLMKLTGLNTGSVDIIKSTTGKYIFLEINPVGQIGMTSIPCNYNLEKLIAEYLIKEHESKH